MPKELKYFIYCRRSQDREDKQTLSIESQRRELLEYAKNHKLNVVEVISEDMSAYKRGRPKFSHMMERIENGKANAVLTWHLTRLARNGADGGLIMSFIDESKILELRTPEKSYFNIGDDKFMMAIHFAMAKKSSDDTSSFVKNNIKTKLEKGEYPGVATYGYLNIDDNGVIAGKKFNRDKQALIEDLGRPLKRIEKDPIEAVLIRKLIELAHTGVYTIGMLCEEGYKLGIKGKLSGKKLSKQTVINILTNVFYTGKFKWGSEAYQGIHEPLITQEEYDRIQVILFRKSKPKITKYEYTFTTLVHCPMCNHTMSGEFQKGFYYYRCIRTKVDNQRCLNRKYIRQDSLDEEIEKTLLRLSIPTKVIEWGIKYLKQAYLEENKTLGSKRTCLQQNISEEKSKLERLTSKWLSPDNADGGLLSDDEYKVEKAKYLKIMGDYELQLDDNGNEESNWLTKCEQFFIKIRDLASEYKKKDVLGKRIILQAIGAKFVRKDERMVVQLEKPYSLILSPESIEDLSELARARMYKPTIEAQDPEIVKWLPRLDSNQRPSD